MTSPASVTAAAATATRELSMITIWCIVRRKHTLQKLCHRKICIAAHSRHNEDSFFAECKHRALADTAKHFLVVELNMGQMVDDVKVSTECKRPVSFYGRTGGVIPTPAEVLAEIEKIAGGLN